ncbi:MULTISPECIES: hypothetical protein [Actinosynnema]|uniref:hypothetical protein n=1 Tax=Actinosynnema TaxID=40566 RepID=UPI0020A43852|nr:hypothetical protein [Actinosynnema pretiosum]MCP2097927.1 hypothetical protein [Actinosynnema pretiosum]
MSWKKAKKPVLVVACLVTGSAVPLVAFTASPLFLVGVFACVLFPLLCAWLSGRFALAAGAFLLAVGGGLPVSSAVGSWWSSTHGKHLDECVVARVDRKANPKERPHTTVLFDCGSEQVEHFPRRRGEFSVGYRTSLVVDPSGMLITEVGAEGLPSGKNAPFLVSGYLLLMIGLVVASAWLPSPPKTPKPPRPPRGPGDPLQADFLRS